MTFAFDMGCFGVKTAKTAQELRLCQALRHRCFVGGMGLEADRFDASYEHYMIAGKEGLVATFRVKILRNQADIESAYTAESYDISALCSYDKPILEIGRFCVAPEADDPNILRLCWGVIAQLVDTNNVGLLIGCTSFEGTDPKTYLDGFHLLARKFRAPSKLRPKAKANELIMLAAATSRYPNRALSQIPPLLRSYLSLGGWVSDHAVIDRELDTIHVFTGLEVCAVPEARANALRSIVPAGLA